MLMKSRKDYAVLKRRAGMTGVVGVLVCFTLFAVAQTSETFTVRLTIMPIDRVMQPNVTGSGSGAARLDGERLFVNGSFSAMHGPATVARVHEGLAMGVRGAALFDLSVVAGVEGTFSGEGELTGEQVESLRAGKLYIQIHSEAAPEGNLWGWLLN